MYQKNHFIQCSELMTSKGVLCPTSLKNFKNSKILIILKTNYNLIIICHMYCIH